MRPASPPGLRRLERLAVTVGAPLHCSVAQLEDETWVVVYPTGTRPKRVPLLPSASTARKDRSGRSVARNRHVVRVLIVVERSQEKLNLVLVHVPHLQITEKKESRRADSNR